jgi:hypothetical protein
MNPFFFDRAPVPPAPLFFTLSRPIACKVFLQVNPCLFLIIRQTGRAGRVSFGLALYILLPFLSRSYRLCSPRLWDFVFPDLPCVSVYTIAVLLSNYCSVRHLVLQVKFRAFRGSANAPFPPLAETRTCSASHAPSNPLCKIIWNRLTQQQNQVCGIFCSKP